jgi:hypothetical protein
MLEFAVDGIDGENSVLADVGVAVFKARATCRYERFKKFGILGNFLQKSECCAAYILVGMLLDRRIS